MALSDIVQPFVWGAGGARKTPDQIARDREMASLLMREGVDFSPVASPWQGLARVANAAAGAYGDYRTDQAEKQNATENQSLIANALAGLGPQQFPAAPSTDGGAPVAATMPQSAEAGVIRQGLIDRGLPEHVADAFVLNFQDESGLNPGINEKNPTVPGSRGGYGLYQLTGPRRVAYEQFAKQRGVDPSDTNTQLDFLMSELQGPEAKAAQSIMAAPDTGTAAAAIVNNFLRPAPENAASRANRYLAMGKDQPVQVASNDPTIGMATAATQSPDGGFQVGGPASTSDAGNRVVQALINPQSMTGGAPMPLQGATPSPQASPQVAQALSGQDLSQIPVMAGGTAGALPPGQAQRGINPAIIEALSSPYASDQTKKIAGLLLGQQLEAQQKANDPMRALDMDYKRAQLDALQGKQQAPQPLVNAGGGAIYNPNTGEWLTAPNQGQTEQPSRVREYEYAKSQGFPGSFNDWLASQKGGMSLQTNPDGSVTFQQGGNIKPMTENQSKDTTFAVRAEGALPILDKFGNALTSFPESAAGALPGGVGNYAQSPEYQQAQQAGTEFLQAILRKDTGAAITPQETAEYGKVYLPRPGDSAEVLAQKQVSRKRALEALKAGMTPQAIVAQEKALQKIGNSAKKPPTVIDGYTIEQVE